MAFKPLIPITGKHYFNLDEETGNATFWVSLEPTFVAEKVDPRYNTSPVKCNIAALEYYSFKKILPAIITKAYQEWRNKFARQNLDRYNQLINQTILVNGESVAV
jgi:hypothetical protein